ncbi:MAG: hypothetical protein QOC78_1775 [Solirubrobacteraceae bacterium]|nr:hypothetical protein [Solirubrobacteraceae bacterium]
MWGYACGVAAGIEHNPTAEQHLSDDGEPFLRYPASAPCLVAVEPDDRLQRTRLGHEVVGTLQALVWDLRSPTDPGPSDETLRLAWELAMGAWELDETVSPPCVWQPAKALYLVDVSPKSGENVVGVPKALLLPVTPALLDCLNLVW